MGLDDDNLFRFLSPSYVLDLHGSDFFVDVANEDNQNHVGTPAHPKPAPSTYLSNRSIPSWSPVFPRARKNISNSTGLGAKVADPVFTSAWSALKSASLLRSSALESTPTFSPEKASVPKCRSEKASAPDQSCVIGSSP